MECWRSDAKRNGQIDRIMERYSLLFVSILAVLASLGGCTKPEDRVVGQTVLLLNHNYLLVASEDGSAASVRVTYSVLQHGWENRVQTLEQTTPCVFGGEPVAVWCDSIHVLTRCKHKILRKEFRIQERYDEGEASYLVVENLSDKPLTYCVVGNSSVHYWDEGYIREHEEDKSLDPSRFIQFCPEPIYRYTPVLYFLHPELAPGGEWIVEGVYQVERPFAIPMGPDRFGDFVREQLPSIPEIVELYRREYAGEELLYENYDKLMRPDKARYPCSMHSLDKERRYFGTLAPKGRIENRGQISFLGYHAVQNWKREIYSWEARKP